MNEPTVHDLAVHDLAAIIREVDGDNQLSAAAVGTFLAARLIPFYDDLLSEDVIAFVERTNPDKTMGAGRLAELIVAEFDLDKEN